MKTLVKRNKKLTWQHELPGTEKAQEELDMARSTTMPDCRNGEGADERSWTPDQNDNREQVQAGEAETGGES